MEIQIEIIKRERVRETEIDREKEREIMRDRYLYRKRGGRKRD